MKKSISLALVLLLAIGGYVGIGPYLAMRAIRIAIAEQDAAALSKQVDFPSLRISLKAQLSDRLVRALGIDAQSSLLGAIGMGLAGGFVNGAVETMATPVGLGALMEGRKVWKRFDDTLQHPDVADPSAVATSEQLPLQNAHYRYESVSRFTATVYDDERRPIVFVMTRSGIRWKLTDVRLPL